VFGQVYHLQKPDYAREVTEASKQAFVLVHLTTSSSSSSTSRNHEESRLLTEILRELASTFRDVKFCEMQGNMCIEGYPDKNCPSILVYRNGEIVRQMLTLRELNGIDTTIEGKALFLPFSFFFSSSSPFSLFPSKELLWEEKLAVCRGDGALMLTQLRN
jgi:hypothetical protein